MEAGPEEHFAHATRRYRHTRLQAVAVSMVQERCRPAQPPQDCGDRRHNGICRRHKHREKVHRRKPSRQMEGRASAARRRHSRASAEAVRGGLAEGRRRGRRRPATHAGTQDTVTAARTDSMERRRQRLRDTARRLHGGHHACRPQHKGSRRPTSYRRERWPTPYAWPPRAVSWSR